MKKRDIALFIISLILIGIFMPYSLNVSTPSDDYLINTNYTCFECDISLEPFLLFWMIVIGPASVIGWIIIKLFKLNRSGIKDKGGIEK